MIDLTGQTTLITGQPVALTAGIAGRMKAAGANVHIHQGDGLDAYERIDTVIILPSWMERGFFMDTSGADWDAALQENYERAVFLSQAAANHMIDRQVAGSIIFVSSVAVHMPMLENSAFATSLAALYPLAKMAAVDCGPYGIRVNTIAAGWVASEWTAPYLQSEDGRAYVENGIPLGHVAQPEMIGDVCCFLASDLSRYITGALIPVDGGYTLTRSEGDSPYPR